MFGYPIKKIGSGEVLLRNGVNLPRTEPPVSPHAFVRLSLAERCAFTQYSEANAHKGESRSQLNSNFWKGVLKGVG